MIQQELADRGFTPAEMEQARQGMLVLGVIIDTFGEDPSQPQFHICIPAEHQCFSVCQYCGGTCGRDIAHFIIDISDGQGGEMDVICLECLDSGGKYDGGEWPYEWRMAA